MVRVCAMVTLLLTGAVGVAGAVEPDEPIPGGAPSPSPSPSPSTSTSPSPSPSTSTSTSTSADTAGGDGDLAAANARTAAYILATPGLGTLRPTVKVGFRRFSTPDDDVDRQQPWNIGVIEVFPWSDFMRIGLVTQVATEEPAAGRDTTDFFMTEGLQIAVAWPQRWFTPFASAHVALGFMRRLGEVEGVAVPSYSALGSAGGDVGVDVRVFRNISLGVSLGVVKPLERRYGVDPDTREVFSDTFTSTEWTLTGYLGW